MVNIEQPNNRSLDTTDKPIRPLEEVEEAKENSTPHFGHIERNEVNHPNTGGNSRGSDGTARTRVRIDTKETGTFPNSNSASVSFLCLWKWNVLSISLMGFL